MISSDTLPFEPYCVSIEKNGIIAGNKARNKNIKEVSVEGDDDSVTKTAALQTDLSVKGVNNKFYHPITVLDKCLLNMRVH